MRRESRKIDLVSCYIYDTLLSIYGGINTYTYVEGDPIESVDPYGLVQIYGNWCGPNWTGGFSKPWDQLSDAEKRNVKPPISELDSACQTHDICHAKCRSDFSCNFYERNQCLKACDDTLAKSAFNFGGVPGLSVGLAMTRPGFRAETNFQDVINARWWRNK